MNGKLVDTNVIIRVLKGVTELFELFDDMDKLYVSSISVGELFYGANLSSKMEYNLSLYKDFCDQMNIISPDDYVAEFYGKIKSQLKKDGKPIPENDIWIAATAMTSNLQLVTADSDFLSVKGLAIQKL